jgi:hypothetical protein
MHRPYFIVSFGWFHKRTVCFLHLLCILHHLLLISIHVVLRILGHQLLLMNVRLFVYVHHAARGMRVHTHLHLLFRNSLHVLKFLCALRTTSLCSLHKRRTILSSYFRHIIASSIIVVRVVSVVLRNKSLSSSPVCVVNKKR